MLIGAVVALGMLFPIASLATNGGNPEDPAKQAGEDRWVPSLAITSGITIQQQQGSADSCFFSDPADISRNCDSIVDPPLRGFVKGDVLAVSPFVGGSLELMAPALPIPTRPRLFVSGEVLPTFAFKRNVALEKDPRCVRGPIPGALCGEGDAFEENSANGEGTRTSAEVDTLVFGASLGVAFPLQVGERQIRIKPSFGWINYEVEVEGIVVNAACDPVERCTTTTSVITLPPPRDPIIIVNDGFLRQPEALTADDTKTFNGIGPGLDIEVDTGKIGPIGSAIFLGARAYHILGDRKIKFGTRQQYDDVFGMDVGVANFEVEVDPWVYRTHVGIRFMWLGNDG